MSKTDYRSEAQRLANEFARNFHAPVVAMSDQAVTEDRLTDADFNFDFAKSPEDIRIEAQQKIWAKDAMAQGQNYCDSVNSGKSGRVYLTPEEKEIKKQVDEYAERQKRGGGYFPKRK